MTQPGSSGQFQTEISSWVVKVIKTGSAVFLSTLMVTIWPLPQEMAVSSCGISLTPSVRLLILNTVNQSGKLISMTLATSWSPVLWTTQLNFGTWTSQNRADSRSEVMSIQSTLSNGSHTLACSYLVQEIKLCHFGISEPTCASKHSMVTTTLSIPLNSILEETWSFLVTAMVSTKFGTLEW